MKKLKNLTRKVQSWCIILGEACVQMLNAANDTNSIYRLGNTAIAKLGCLETKSYARSTRCVFS